MERASEVTAASALLHRRFQEKKLRLAELLRRLGALCDAIVPAGDGVCRETADGLLASLEEPFLFVVVGEVKTGKSSLVNALLGENLCQVAPDPCTDRIRMILYGEAASESAAGPYLSHMRAPRDILRDIAVVDTPGVDSIIDRHQEITERFIPKSDLVLFVFSAINPYSRSAWDFFSLVRQEWRRKVIFVLNQADLATPEQLRVNEAQVRRLAEERGVPDPVLFAVSSSLGQTDPQAGGIEAVRRYIRDMVTGGGHYAQKLVSLCDAARRMIEDLERNLTARRAEVDRDAAQAEGIRERMLRAREAADREAAALVDRVGAIYARLTREFADAFEDELTFGNMIGRSLRGMFRRGRGGLDGRTSELAREFAARLNREMEDAAALGASRVAEGILERLRPLLDELDGRDRLAPPASGTFADARENVAREVRQRVEAMFQDGGGLDGISPRGVAELDPKAAMGGVLMVVGTLFAVSVKSVVVDVTGGLVAATGMLLTGGALLWKRPRIMRVFRGKLAEAGQRLESELSERLTARLTHLFAELTRRFDPLFADIAARDGAVRDRTEDVSALSRDCEEFARDVGRGV